MYAGYYAGSHTPANTTGQEAELRHQVRRLTEHPSVAIYDSCNECSASGLYTSFVMTTIVDEDPSRTPWPASPSKGWASGVDSLTGLPNGKPLVEAGVPADAAALLPPPPAPRRAAGAGNASCAFVPNEDFDTKVPGPLPSEPAASPQECCDLCAAHAGCASATFDGKNCVMKTVTQAALPFFTQDRVGVWLASSGPVPDPIPPPPPPGKLKCAPQAGEAHGPYRESCSRTPLRNLRPPPLTQGTPTHPKQSMAAGSRRATRPPRCSPLRLRCRRTCPSPRSRGRASATAPSRASSAPSRRRPLRV